jgi:hypothetical protein
VLEDGIEQALRQLLYAPGVVATRSAYPAASRRTAPSSRIKPSSHSSIRLMFASVQQAAFKDDLELGRPLTLTNFVCGEYSLYFLETSSATLLNPNISIYAIFKHSCMAFRRGLGGVLVLGPSF